MTISGPPARRRCCLSVPASSRRMLEKAAGLEADELVLDLEDAVVPAQKGKARELVADALAGPGLHGRQVAVRVNAPRTPWCHLDLVALAELPRRPRSIVVPKVESAGDLAFVERLLDGLESEMAVEPLRVQALIETAAGLTRVAEIAAASERLEALVLGYADLAASLGRSVAAATDPARWLAAQEAVLTSARAHGLEAIDGPYLGTEPDQPFLDAAHHAHDLGFDGKWAIHPSQLAPLREVFTPAPKEVARAREVLAALERAEREDGHGAVAHEGEMIDEAVAVAARRVLARAGADAGGEG